MDATAIVTGGTGGLGRAVVARFAADGWRVVVPDARPAELDGAEVVEADLTDPDAVARAVAVAQVTGPPLRAVVNLVGGFAADQPVADTPFAEFEAQFTLNLRPTYLVSQAALPVLAAAGGGAIVCVSSRSALYPFAGAAGYCASKAAALAFAQVVAREDAARRRPLQRRAAVDDRHAGEPRGDAARGARQADAARGDRRRDPLPVQRRVGADERRRDPRLRRLSRRRSGSPCRRARACGARCRRR